jgi:hypothetical protein
MNSKLLNWIKMNSGRIFESPRSKNSRRETKKFRIIKLDNENKIVHLEFMKSFTLLRLEFWRFEIALEVLERNKKQWVRLGGSYDSKDPNTIEYAIQTKARKLHPNREKDLKSAPHVCDILVLSEIAEYGKAINPITDRENQAVRLKSNKSNQ